MSRYAVKIGEVHLISDKPITNYERKCAIKALKAAERSLEPESGTGGLKIVDVVRALA